VQIVQALRTCLRLLTPEQIEQARDRLGFFPSELAERLGVTEETVRRWESGLLARSRARDNLLRVYFALPDVHGIHRGQSRPRPGSDPVINPAREARLSLG